MNEDEMNFMKKETLGSVGLPYNSGPGNERPMFRRTGLIYFPERNKNPKKDGSQATDTDFFRFVIRLPIVKIPAA